jgi:hypothetical protein
MPDPKPDDVDFHEETTDPLVADLHNFYKVEKWTKDGSKVDSLLYAGNNLGRAQEVFAKAVSHRPRIRLTIRQRTGFCRSGHSNKKPRPMETGAELYLLPGEE